MNKCITCGYNLYPISKDPEFAKYGTPLHNYFAIDFKPAEEFLDKYGLNICCRTQLLTYIPDTEFSRRLPRGSGVMN